VIVGLGVDVVDVARFARVLERTPRVASRLLTDRERAVGRPERLAARFAAKEALAKALGAPGGLRWHDAEVVAGTDGRPLLEIRGTVAAAADALGATGWHVSLSHDGGTAVAVVVVES
jgi:holo-[acyl-carrier protein] synthase